MLAGFRPHQGIIFFNEIMFYFTVSTEYNASFRPHQGIIFFNEIMFYFTVSTEYNASFRPHQGIIFFNFNIRGRLGLHI